MIRAINKSLVRVFCKAVRVFLPLILMALDKLGLYRPMAFLLVLTIKANTLLWKFRHLQRFNKKSDWQILAFDRGVFERDLLELERRTDLNIIFFPNLLYATFANAFLPKYLRSQITYHLTSFAAIGSPFVRQAAEGCVVPCNERILEIKANLRQIIRQILPHLIKGLNIRALLSGNVDYYTDQEWINACNEAGFPFLAVDLESGRVNFAQYNIPAADADFKLNIRRFAVCSEVGKETFLKSDTLKEGQLVVTGFPRTDLVFDAYTDKGKLAPAEDKRGSEKWIVLFDFAERDQKKLCDDTVDVFYKLAAENTDKNLKFVMKTKGVGFTRSMEQYLANTYGSVGGVIVDHEIPFTDIVSKSILLCGFSSSGLVKMLFTNIPLVLVRWADGLGYIPDMMFVEDHSPAYTVTHSKADFEAFLRGVISSPDTAAAKAQESRGFREARDKIIGRYLFRIDGRRSFAVADFIKQGIQDLTANVEQASRE